MKTDRPVLTNSSSSFLPRLASRVHRQHYKLGRGDAKARGLVDTGQTQDYSCPCSAVLEHQDRGVVLKAEHVFPD